MEHKKFQRYCPNCNNYGEHTGVCSYIHENVLLYPEKFIEHCDGRYFSLIKGKAIEPIDERDTKDTEFDGEKSITVSVFSDG